MKKWFYWTFDRKNWTHVSSWKTGKKYLFDSRMDFAPTGSYPQVIQEWKHKSGLIKHRKRFLIKLGVVKAFLGYGGTGPR